MPSWTKPTPELVDRVIARLARPEHARRFFDGLDNPHWVEALGERGVFASPPAAIRHESEGTISFPPWPQSRYLARMAAHKEAHDAVAAVIGTLGSTDNAAVRADVVDALIALPAAIAAGLFAGLAEWAQPPLFFLLPQKLAELCSTLASGGEKATALRLFGDLFEPVVVEPEGDESEFSLYRRQARPSFSAWDYAEALKKTVPELVRSCGFEAVRLAVEMLSRAVAASVTSEEAAAAGVDFSYIWRQSVAPSPRDAPVGDVRDSLIAAVRLGVDEHLRSGGYLDDVVDLLLSQKWLIHRRIAMLVLGERLPSSLARSRQLALDPEQFDEVGVRHEYVGLLREVFPLLGTAQQDLVLGWIDEGRSLASLEEWMREKEDRDPTEEESERWIGTWQRDRLAPLREVLPEPWARRLRDLEERYGVAEHPEFPFHTTSFSGPTSPLEVEELVSKPIAEVVQFLKQWEAPAGHFEATPEGLGRTLSEAVKERADEASRAAREFIGLEPTYVRSVLQGLRQALRESSELDWDAVVDLCAWAAQQRRDEAPAGRLMERDPDWGWTRKAAVDLLGEGMVSKAGGIQIELREKVWAVVDVVLDDPNPTREDDTSTTMDPATHSINTVRGEAVHTLFRYVIWLDRELDGTGLDRMPEARDRLERHLVRDLEPSPAIRSAYGRWLPWLHAADPSWTREHLTAIFGEAPGSDPLAAAARRSYLVFNRVWDSVFRDLLPVYERWVGDLAGQQHSDLEAGPWSSDRKLGEHLALAYGRGLVDLAEDGGWTLFLKSAPTAVAKEAVAWFGRSLRSGEGEAPEPTLVDQLRGRAVELWEWLERELPEGRFAEIAGAFGAWLASPFLDQDWVIPTLQNATKRAVAISDEHALIKSLEGVAESYPASALDIARNLIERDESSWHVYAWRGRLRTILIAAVGDPAARDSALQFIDWLGERGFHQFRDIRTMGR